MTIKVAIQEFLKVVQNNPNLTPAFKERIAELWENDLTEEQEQEKEREEGANSRFYLLTFSVISPLVNQWGYSKELKNADTAIKQMKQELLAMMSIPGLLTYLASSEEVAEAEKVDENSKEETISVLDVAAKIVLKINAQSRASVGADNFHSTFFNSLLKIEATAIDAANIVDFIKNFNFIKELQFLTPMSSEFIVKLIFSRASTELGRALIAELFAIDKAAENKALTKAITQDIETNSTHAISGEFLAIVQSFSKQEGIDREALYTKGSAGFKAAHNIIYADEAKAKADLAWLMDVTRTVVELTIGQKSMFAKASSSSRVTTLALHDEDAFAQALKQYFDRFTALSQDNLSNRDHKAAKRLAELLNKLSPGKHLELEEILDKEAFFHLSLAVIKSLRDTYDNESKTSGKAAKRLLQGGTTKSDEKLQFLAILSADLESRKAEFIATVDLEEVSSNDSFKVSGAEQPTGIIAQAFNTIKKHDAKDWAEINTWLKTTILPGKDLKNVLRWFPEAYLKESAQNTILLHLAAPVPVAQSTQKDNMEGAKEAGDVLPRTKNRQSIKFGLSQELIEKTAQKATNENEKGLASVAEESAFQFDDNSDDENDRVKVSPFGRTSSTLAANGAQAAEEQSRATKGENKSIFSVPSWMTSKKTS